MPAGGQPARRRRRRPTGRAAAARSQPSNAAAAGTPPQLCRALSEAAKACKFAGWTWSRLGQTRTETRTEGPATAQALRSRGGLRRLSESSYPSHLVRVFLSESSCPSLPQSERPATRLPTSFPSLHSTTSTSPQVSTARPPELTRSSAAPCPPSCSPASCSLHMQVTAQSRPPSQVTAPDVTLSRAGDDEGAGP